MAEAADAISATFSESPRAVRAGAIARRTRYIHRDFVFDALRQSWQQTKARIQADVFEESMQRAAARATATPRAHEMPAIAREFVHVCESQRIQLDGTPATLPALDRWIAGARPLLAEAEATRTPGAAAQTAKCLLWTTAYVGEVLRGQTAGPWLDVSGQPAIRLGPSVHLFPLIVVSDLLRVGSAHAGDRLVHTASEYVELAQGVQHHMALLAVFQGYTEPDQLERTMSGVPDLSEWLVRQCLSAVKTAGAMWGVSLDFTEPSLEGLDRILGELSRMQAEAPPLERATDDQVKAAIATWGTYLGETLRRSHGGTWRVDGATRGLSLVIDGHTFRPFNAVQKRLDGDEAESVAFFARVVGRAVNDFRSGPAAKAS